MIPHVGGGVIREDNKNDAWVVFLEEREKMIDAWDELKKPVFILTGDLHNSFAIKITDNVWEFASAPRNSGNHWYTDEGDRPATGEFNSAGRTCDIRWSTWFTNEVPRDELKYTVYCKVKVNNVFNNAEKFGGTRWIAYERPQVIFQYYDGRTGDLLYAESITAGPE
jgi:hypothetical protein